MHCFNLGPMSIGIDLNSFRERQQQVVNDTSVPISPFDYSMRQMQAGGRRTCAPLRRPGRAATSGRGTPVSAR